MSRRRNQAFQPFAAALLAGAALTAAGGSARADWCYEELGCVQSQRLNARALSRLGCQNLWDVRNRIYRLGGYCFTSPAAIQTFGNDSCRYRSVSAVPLTAIMRANVQAVRQAERAKSCT